MLCLDTGVYFIFKGILDLSSTLGSVCGKGNKKNILLKDISVLICFT